MNFDSFAFPLTFDSDQKENALGKKVEFISSFGILGLSGESLEFEIELLILNNELMLMR